jgi:hypothetical protein
MGKHTCEGCNGSGYRIATRDDGYRAIERCDTCEVFLSDEDARNHVVKEKLLPPYINIEPDYPCYLWVSLLSGKEGAWLTVAP